MISQNSQSYSTVAVISMCGVFTGPCKYWSQEHIFLCSNRCFLICYKKARITQWKCIYLWWHCPFHWRGAAFVPHGPCVCCKVVTAPRSLLWWTTILMQISKLNVILYENVHNRFMSVQTRIHVIYKWQNKRSLTGNVKYLAMSSSASYHFPARILLLR